MAAVPGRPSDQALIEREEPLDVLDRCLADALEGSGRFVVVRGEAGVGKTALVRAFTAKLPSSVRVFAGGCDGVSTPRPFAPLEDMADALGPALRELLDTDAPRTRISSWLLGRLSSEQAVVLVVEDIQWADDATLELLPYLARRIEDRPILAIATVRDDEGPAPNTQRILGSLATLPPVRHVLLDRLSQGGVWALVAGSGLDAVEVHRLTAGNPFFVWEVIQAGGRAIPVSVRDAIRARVSSLGESGRRALEAAAILGAAEPWLFAAVTGEDVTGVDDCLEAGLLVRSDGIAFRHELTRMTVLEDLPVFRGVALHRRALRALRASGITDTSRLAYHADGAADRGAVLEFAPAAGRRALAMGAFHEAIAQLARALRYADGLSASARADLLEPLARARYLVNEASAAYAAAVEAVQLRRQSDGPWQLAHALRMLALIAWLDEHGEEAWRAAQEAVALLDPLGDDRELALAYATLGRLGVSAGTADDACGWSQRALEIGRRVGDPEPTAIALSNIGTVKLVTGDDTGRDMLLEALEIGRAAGLPEVVDRALNNLGICSIEVRRLDAAERHFRDLLEFSERSELELCSIDGARAEIADRQGRWQDAEAFARRAFTAPRTDPIDRALAQILLARLAIRRGEGELEALLREPSSVAARLATTQLRWPLAALQAEAAWLAGGLGTAVPALLEAYREACDARAPWAIGELGRWLWRARTIDAPDERAAGPYRLETHDPRAAAAEWDGLGMPFESAMALAGSADPADLRRAYGEFMRLGATAVARRTALALRDAGAPVPRGPRPATVANPAGLTEREAEVARLIAAGLSNADIASQLVLSEKTVGHHVSAVLGKLGVPRRAGVGPALRDLAAAAPAPQEPGSGDVRVLTRR